MSLFILNKGAISHLYIRVSPEGAVLIDIALASTGKVVDGPVLYAFKEVSPLSLTKVAVLNKVGF